MFGHRGKVEGAKRRPSCIVQAFVLAVWVFVLGVGFASCVAIMDDQGGGNRGPNPSPPSSTLMPGSPVVLRSESSPTAPILVGSSREAYDEAIRLLASGDTDTLNALMLADYATYLPAGTPGTLASRGFTVSSLTVSPGHKLEGNTVWTATEFVRTTE